jgi:hypothetical protein
MLKKSGLSATISGIRGKTLHGFMAFELRFSALRPGAFA